MAEWKNTLYYGDNLAVMREYLTDESVDLIYLDPPFNSNRNYNVLFKDESGDDIEAQIIAFEDTWHWGRSSEEIYEELAAESSERISSMIGAFRQFIGANQMMAYIVMMTARLIEMRRILKATGSLYLHCDPTASHYLKIVTDTIFGSENFKCEIIWERSQTRSSISRNYRKAHDTILFYTKSENYVFNMQYRQLSESSLSNYRNQDDKGQYRMVPLLVSGKRQGETGKVWRGVDPNTRGKSGMHWITTHDKLEEYDRNGLIIFSKNGIPNLKYYLEKSPGMPLNDNWHDIQLIPSSSGEAMGYPTQKPVKLLDRIIQASSDEGDIVFDPFCGCGTAIISAQKLNRRWIGIDITHLAVALQKYRLKEAYGLIEKKDYKVIGEPKDSASARQLAQEDRYQFQWWALSLIQAKPVGGETGSRRGKKGKDRGIDGVITFIDNADRKIRRIIVQVKSGKVKPGDIRDLVGTVDRDKAAMGIFITLENHSRDMEKEAAAAGYYHSEGWGRKYPRIQIFTIEQLLNGDAVNMPPINVTFSPDAAQREDNVNNGIQNGLW